METWPAGPPRQRSPASKTVRSRPAAGCCSGCRGHSTPSSARAAEREGTSLNGFITGALASTIGWRGEDGELVAGPSTRAPADRRQARLLLVVLVANAVVVGLAALAALGVLLFAWLG